LRSGSNFRGRVRDFCSLCGKRDHKAVDGCPHVVSDAGKVHPKRRKCKKKMYYNLF
jgi:hypothetical protein